MKATHLSEVTDRLTRMETIVGVSPEEGLRFEIQAIRVKLDQIQYTVTKHIYLAFGGGAVLLWIMDLMFAHH